MNGYQRRALMIKRKQERFIKTIIFCVCVFILIISITFILIKTMNPNDGLGNVGGTVSQKKRSDTKQPFKYYNPFFQPLDLDIEYYLNKEAEPIVNPIKLINDNSAIVDIEATNAVVIDAANMTVLYNKNGSAKCYPASTTKIMTALVALESCGKDFVIEVSDEIDMIKEGSSIAYLSKGNRLTLNMLIEGLLLMSGNDAAYTMAVNIGRYINPNPKLTDSLAVGLFGKLMTDRAKSIGANDTNFTVPDGFYDEHHYTTAYDMGLIAFEAMKNPIIKETVSKTSVRNIFITGQDVTWNNTNLLLAKGGPYYYQYAMGIKTGTNDESGYCLLSYAEKDNKKLITIIMNSTQAGRWNDTIKLYEYFFGEEF